MVELAVLVILGIMAPRTAWRFKIPAILPLVRVAIAVVRMYTLSTEDGSKIIGPVWNGDVGLFPGESLFYFVSLAIGIILNDPLSYTSRKF